MMPATEEAFDIMDDEFVDVSNWHIEKKGSQDEKWLETSGGRLL